MGVDVVNVCIGHGGTGVTSTTRPKVHTFTCNERFAVGGIDFAQNEINDLWTSKKKLSFTCYKHPSLGLGILKSKSL